MKKTGKALILITTAILAILYGVSFYRLPDRVYVSETQEPSQLFDMATVKESVTVEHSNGSNIPQDNLNITCKFLGVIPLKQVEVRQVEDQYVIPCGLPVGIYMETDGVLAVGTGKVTGMDGLDYEPAQNIIQSGDYIKAINGKPIQTKEELINLVEASGGDRVTLQVERGNETQELAIEPIQTERDSFRLGIWVRDDTQGIGTMTYYKQDGTFGALGHSISDVDTGEPLNLKEGKLYHAQILSIHKGIQGSPGELSGVIKYGENHIMGQIYSNTTNGIFGVINQSAAEEIKGTPVPIAFKQEVEVGPASILVNVNGTLEEYDAEIRKVNLGSGSNNKNMVVQVTDQELIELTGGIVQGMSGSPILQKGKLVGAINHVFIQDSTSGYGIFIENMISVE